MAVTRLFGSSVKRVEDPRLISGHGSYTDDIKLPGMAYMAILRSPYAHARIKRIDTTQAKQHSGVYAVFTGADLHDKVGPIPCAWLIPDSDLKVPPYRALCSETVRYTGDAVAAVVASSQYIAHDALDLIEVEYEPLPTVTTQEEALTDGAPQLHEEAPGNLAFHWKFAAGDADKALAEGEVVLKERFVQQRLIPNAMEPRGALAQWMPVVDELTIWNTTQNPHIARYLLSVTNGIAENKIRVVARDVGGGFGSKIPFYPWDALTAYAARATARPVKWIETRRENYVATTHGRDEVIEVELAARRDGTITGLRVKNWANMGAYLSTAAPGVPTWLFALILPGCYSIENYACDVYGVFTNTTPTDAYRGAGRPEAAFVIERMVDLLAAKLGVDPAQVRRKNFIPKSAFPYTNAGTLEYDSGDYEATLDLALKMVDYDQLRARQRANPTLPSPTRGGAMGEGARPGASALSPARGGAMGEVSSQGAAGATTKPSPTSGVGARHASPAGATSATRDGKYLGIGLSTYVEVCGLAPSKAAGIMGFQGGLWEPALVRLLPTGKAYVFTGTNPHGQGEETTFAQIVGQELGIPLADIEVVHGDTAQIAMGWGTYGSRTTAVGGTAILLATRKVREKAQRLAAHLLEASPEDIVFDAGRFYVAGSPAKAKTIQEIALMANLAWNMPEGMQPGLEESYFFDPTNFTFPFGAHVCVVEVDAETGEIEILRYVAVDDVGNVINPMIVDGQVHGGVAQGIGQALYEHAIYDENGQLTSGSMMDYTVPNATQIPFIETARTVTPSPSNPMGLKGVGETGTIAATQAVVNAVVDALAPLGVRRIEMPMTPERVWRAIQDAQRNPTLPSPARGGAMAEAAQPGAGEAQSGQAEPQNRSYPERGEEGVPIQDERPAPTENQPFEGQGLSEDLHDEGKS